MWLLSCVQKLAMNSLFERQAHLPTTVNITLGMSGAEFFCTI